MDIRLKLGNGLCGKGVRDELSLPAVLNTVPCVKEPSAYRDKGIIELTAPLFVSPRFDDFLLISCLMKKKMDTRLRF